MLAPFRTPRALWLSLLMVFALVSCTGKPGAVETPEAAGTTAVAPAPMPTCIGDEPLIAMGLGPSDPQVAAGIPCVRFAVDVDDAPSRGPADAPVTLVMFSDFECPFCRQGYDTVKALEREYGDKLRFVYKSFPIDRHPDALIAALVAQTALEQDKFWPFHDLLFSQKGLDIDTLFGYAQQVGLDPGNVETDLDSLRHAPVVKRDMRQAKRLDVRSTPTFFVNGRQVRGAKELSLFRAVIEEELSFVAEWERGGVKAPAMYDHAIEFGYTEIVYEEGDRDLDEAKVYPVTIGDSPTKGPEFAPLTVVAFGDFQCPFCARGFRVMRALEQAYGDDMRVVYKHFPLPGHSLAIPAARASMAAGAQGKFWEYHDTLYETSAKFSLEDLDLIAEQLGLDMKKFHADMDSFDKQIKADLALGMNLGVTGTPAFFVNGRPIEGAQPELMFRMLFAEEFERAKELEGRGVPVEKRYDALTGQIADIDPPEL